MQRGLMRMPWPLLLCIVLAASDSKAADRESHQRLRVLFIGNSYLYSNDLPRQVQILAADRGVLIEATLLAEPDYSLSDHLDRRRLDPLLEQSWDWVVLQQGPSALPESRRELTNSVERIAQRFGRRSTRIALMSAWPAQRNAAMSTQAEASYRAAAIVIGACVLPAATAWRLTAKHPAAPGLYQADRLHPTPAGSLLAAMVVTRGLLGMDPSVQWAVPSDEDVQHMQVFQLLDEVAREADSWENLRCASIPSSAKRET